MTSSEIALVQTTKLSDIVLRNTNIECIPHDMFVVPEV